MLKKKKKMNYLAQGQNNRDKNWAGINRDMFKLTARGTFLNGINNFYLSYSSKKKVREYFYFFYFFFLVFLYLGYEIFRYGILRYDMTILKNEIQSK